MLAVPFEGVVNKLLLLGCHLLSVVPVIFIHFQAIAVLAGNAMVLVHVGYAVGDNLIAAAVFHAPKVAILPTT